MRKTPIRIIAPALIAASVPLVHAADDATDPEGPKKLAPIVVTATRNERSSFEVPVSIDAVDQTQIREARPTVNLSEALSTVPGVVVSNRQNYAQDLQVSTRGFGARSTFGVRGVRIIADDIPLTMPDGQGQVATIDLTSARRIEVLRGPYSSIYGNSSGGVIQAFTEDGPADTTVGGGVWVGSFRSNKEDLKVGGTSGNFNYVASGSRFDTLGYRDHSEATRTQENAKVNYKLDDRSNLTLVYNDLRQPFTQDPLGLSRAQFDRNPQAADPAATQYNTRKSIQNSQGGLVYDRHLTDQDLVKLVGYVGTREIVQYLATPYSAQNNVAGSSGGVVNLDTHFAGLGLRWIHDTTVRGAPLTLTAGIEFDNEVQTRKGYNDYIGAGTILGVQGALRRNEDDTVYDINQYVQAELKATERLLFTAGLRHSEIQIKSEDYYLTNGNDSGSKHFDNVSPVFGVLYKITPTLNVYANAGQGFETPTLAEIAYRSTSQAGLNFALQPSVSKSYEAGVKALLGESTRLNAAIFHVGTSNEIVQLSNQGGRTTYQNAGATHRRGVEVGVESEFGYGITGLLAATWLDAEFARTYRYAATGTTPNRTVSAGNHLPGVPSNEVHGELAWHLGAFSTALELVYNDRLFVDDINSAAAPSYVVANLRAAVKQNLGHWQLEEYARVDNIGDRRYIGSVIVNESNGRFYESAPGRNYLAGVRAAYRF